MGLARFNSEFDNAVSVAIKGSEKAIKQGVERLFTRIIMDTPVDTGQLKGNWQASIGSPVTAQLKGTLDAGGFNTVRKVKDVLNSLKLDASIKSIYMSNNLDYATRIEYGQYSNKAPYGMVRVNVAKFKSEIDKAANKFRR